MLLFSNLSEISEWKPCESYIFDKSLRNSTNIMFGNGEEWETAVTQFELVCENDWINSLGRILKNSKFTNYPSELKIVKIFIRLLH